MERDSLQMALVGLGRVAEHVFISLLTRNRGGGLGLELGKGWGLCSQVWVSEGDLRSMSEIKCKKLADGGDKSPAWRTVGGSF